MAKYKLSVNETRSFGHVIEVETELNEDQLDSLITEKIDNDKTLNSLDDIKYTLREYGIKLINTSQDEDGNLGEITIEELEEIEEIEEMEEIK